MNFLSLPYRLSYSRTTLLISALFMSPTVLSSEYATSDPASTIIEDFTTSDAVQDTGRDFSGHRIGMGGANAAYLDANIFVFDYGYEFNRYIGFMLSGSSYDDDYDIGIPSSGGVTTLKNDGSYTRVATDIGYTFDLKGFDLKPYVSTGIIYLSESTGLENNSETKFQYGVGLRATLDVGVYIDASYKMANLDSWIDSTSERDGEEAILTIGYKF